MLLRDSTDQVVPWKRYEKANGLYVQLVTSDLHPRNMWL